MITQQQPADICRASQRTGLDRRRKVANFSTTPLAQYPSTLVVVEPRVQDDRFAGPGNYVVDHPPYKPA